MWMSIRMTLASNVDRFHPNYSEQTAYLRSHIVQGKPKLVCSLHQDENMQIRRPHHFGWMVLP